MLEDAKKYLVPELKKTVPVDKGHLRDSIGVRKYVNQWRIDANNPAKLLVQRIELYAFSGNRSPHTIVYGSVAPSGRRRKPDTEEYGHVQYSENRKFAALWDRVVDKYEREFGKRIEIRIGQILSLI